MRDIQGFLLAVLFEEARVPILYGGQGEQSNEPTEQFSYSDLNPLDTLEQAVDAESFLQKFRPDFKGAERVYFEMEVADSIEEVSEFNRHSGSIILSRLGEDGIWNMYGPPNSNGNRHPMSERFRIDGRVHFAANGFTPYPPIVSNDEQDPGDFRSSQCYRAGSELARQACTDGFVRFATWAHVRV